MKKIITTALLFLAFTNIQAQNIIYVSSTATGANAGFNWTNAYTTLIDALNSLPSVPTSSYQIWVKSGTYYPSKNNNRSESLSLKNNVAIYGGFVGNETVLTQRDWKKNLTILSGDIGTSGVETDNSSTILFNTNAINNTAILDGFTITRAYSKNTYPIKSDGGGMYLQGGASPTLRNLIFLNNQAFGYGGGMCNINTSSTNTSNPTAPIMTNIVFDGNSANNGGGMFNFYSNPIVKNALFINNVASGDGGAINNINCLAVRFANVTVYNNSANFGNGANSGAGGGVSNYGYLGDACIPSFQNCIFWGNSASTVGNSQISNTGSTDIDISNCDVQGGASGPSNIDADPNFVQPTLPKGADGYYFTGDDGLTLKKTSSCIDAGGSFIPVPVTDITGFPRNTTSDIGSYEVRIITSLNSGAWETASTWLNALIPTKNEYTIVNSGHIITVNNTTQYPNATADVAKEITVKGTLRLNASSKANIGY